MTQKASSLHKLEKVSRNGIRDHVYDQILSMLLCGEIPPGESMPIRVLAERLGTSPMPVREALRQLLSEGGIEMQPNRTIRVPMMTLPRLIEITRLRVLLEGALAADAAERISAADIKSAQNLNQKWRRHTLGTRIDVPKSMRYNMLLHFTVYQAAAQPITVKIVRSLWLQVAPFFGMIMRDMRERGSSTQGIANTGAQHDRLVACLETRDSAGTRRAVIDDILTAADVYISCHWPEVDRSDLVLGVQSHLAAETGLPPEKWSSVK